MEPGKATVGKSQKPILETRLIYQLRETRLLLGKVTGMIQEQFRGNFFLLTIRKALGIIMFLQVIQPFPMIYNVSTLHPIPAQILIVITTVRQLRFPKQNGWLEFIILRIG